MSLARRNTDQWGMMDWDWGMDTFKRRLDNLERSFFNDIGGGQLATTTGGTNFAAMKVDLKELDNKFELVAEMPGLEKKDISIDLDEDKRMLTIKGEKKFEKEEKRDEGKYYYKERSFGSFNRCFKLPDNVNMEQVKASMSNGLLRVDIPKIEQRETKRVRNIQVGEVKSNA